jgi:hypothetical protein
MSIGGRGENLKTLHEMSDIDADMALFMASGFDGFVEDSRTDPKFLADNAQEIELLSQSLRNARTLGHFAKLAEDTDKLYKNYREALPE